jgi:hypothetical protein
MKQRHFPAAFKCYWNYHKIHSLSNDNLYYKMVIHVHSDSVFRRYQQEMRFVKSALHIPMLSLFIL